MRVVLDTNVVVSGLLWSGTARRVIEAVGSNGLVVLTTEALIEELDDLLDRPKMIKRLEKINASKESIVDAFLSFARTIEAVDVTEPLLRDRDDLIVLACAAGGNADFIVTGDHDLLGLDGISTLKILSPAEFLLMVAPD